MFSTKVQSTHLDQFGHVNNAKYFEYFEWARWDWANSLGCDFRYYFKHNLAPVVVHMEIDFIKELSFNEEIVITTTVDKIKGKSFILKQEIRLNGAAVSTLYATLVFIDEQSRKAVEIPEDFHKTLTINLNK